MNSRTSSPLKHVLVCGMLFGVPAVGRTADPPKPSTNKQAELDRTRLEVLKALEQFREAESRLRQAEKRLCELEGKAGQAAEETPAITKIFSVKGKASSVAKTLTELFGKSGATIVADEGTNSLIVRAKPDDLFQIAQFLQDLDNSDNATRAEGGFFVYRLKNVEAVALAKVLTNLFDKDQTRIVADPATNSLLVRAGEEQRRMIEKLIPELDTAADPRKPKQPMK